MPDSINFSVTAATPLPPVVQAVGTGGSRATPMSADHPPSEETALSLPDVECAKGAKQKNQNIINIENDIHPTTIAGLAVEARTIEEFLDEAYHASPSIPYRYLAVILTLGLSNSSDSAEILCLAFLLSDPTVQSTMLKGVILNASVLACSVFFGGLFGNLVVGSMSDVYGRRTMLLTGLIITASMGLCSAVFSQDIYSLSFLRFLTGIGIGCTSPALLSIISELAPPSLRGRLITVVSSFWIVGSIFVSLVAWVILQHGTASSWRWFLVVTAVPSTCSIVLVMTLVAESPRFLAVHGRPEDAARSLRRLGQQMNYHGPPMTVAEIKCHHPQSNSSSGGGNTHIEDHHADNDNGLQDENVGGNNNNRMPLPHRSRKQNMCRVVYETCKSFLSSTATLFSWSLLPTSIPLLVVWVGLCYGANGVTSWITRLFQSVGVANLYFNALLFAIAQIPGAIYSAVAMDVNQRHTMLSSGFLGSAVSLLSFACFASAITVQQSTRTLGVVVSACAFQTFIELVWNTVSVVTTERFPTTHRATAWAVFNSSGRLAGAIAGFVNGYLIAYSPVLLLVVAGLAMLMASVAPFLLPQRGLDDELADDVPIETNDASMVAVVATRSNSERTKPKSNKRVGGEISYQGVAKSDPCQIGRNKR